MLSAAIPNQIEERIGKTFLAVLSTAPAIAKPIPASPIAPSQPKKLSKIGGLLSSKTGNGAGNKNPMNANRESANQRKNAPAKPANMIPTMGAHLLIRLFTFPTRTVEAQGQWVRDETSQVPIRSFRT